MFRSLPIGRVVLLCLFGVVIVLGATSSAPSVLGASGAVYQLIKPEVVHQGLTAEAWKNIQASIERDQYALQALGASYLAPNRGMKSRFSAEGFEVRPSTKNTSWTWSLMLTGYSYGERIQPVSPVQPYVDQNRIEYRRGNLVEQYVNDHRGVHQGFTIAVAPTMRSTRSLLEVHLATQGNLKPAVGQDRTGITWVNDSGSVVLNYSGLRAWDVQGKTLRAQMALTANGIVLIVEDSLAQYPVTIDSFTQLAKLTASDGSQSDSFGTTVAISGTTLVVGASNARIGVNSQQGAVYVYEKPNGGWVTTSAFSAKLTASDGAADDHFGASIAISGTTIVIGVPNKAIEFITAQGAVYVFEKPSGGWSGTLTETAKLTVFNGSGNHRFGTSVAINGTTIVGGAPGVNRGQGAVYVYEKPKEGWATTSKFTANITAPDDSSYVTFGRSVAISGTTIVVGATTTNAAYVYEKPGKGWASTSTFIAKLTVSTASERRTVGFFGYSVAMSGTTIVVGAPSSKIGDSPQQGAAYVYEKPSGGWTSRPDETAKLTASDGAASDSFGTSVAIDSNTILVGATGAKIGAAYVYGK